MISPAVYSTGDVVRAVEASVKEMDTAAKTISVKTEDGAEHTFHIVGHTTVHGADATSNVTKTSWQDLREGSDVIVHYTKRGSEEAAEEIDRLGEDGLKETKGTLSKLDRSGKKDDGKRGRRRRENVRPFRTRHARCGPRPGRRKRARGEGDGLLLGKGRAEDHPPFQNGRVSSLSALPYGCV